MTFHDFWVKTEQQIRERGVAWVQGSDIDLLQFKQHAQAAYKEEQKSLIKERNKLLYKLEKLTDQCRRVEDALLRIGDGVGFYHFYDIQGDTGYTMEECQKLLDVINEVRKRKAAKP